MCVLLMQSLDALLVSSVAKEVFIIIIIRQQTETMLLNNVAY